MFELGQATNGDDGKALENVRAQIERLEVKEKAKRVRQSGDLIVREIEMGEMGQVE